MRAKRSSLDILIRPAERAVSNVISLIEHRYRAMMLIIRVINMRFYDAREKIAVFNRRRRLLSRHLLATLSLSIASIRDHPSPPPPSRPSSSASHLLLLLPPSFTTSSSPAVVASFFRRFSFFFPCVQEIRRFVHLVSTRSDLSTLLWELGSTRGCL